MAPIKGKRTQTRPAAVMKSGNTLWELFANAAEANRISPETLWGVFGTESNYGADNKASSAGALGPMQFLPSTGAEYGLNSTTIWEIPPSVYAAARYLKALGADESPTSSNTIAALNGYNGNEGGASATSYSDTVLQKGKSYGGTTSPSGGGPSEADGAAPSGESGASPVGLLSDIESTAGLIKAITEGNVGGISEDFSLLALSLVKDFGVGLYELIWAPVWHWNQRSVMWYSKHVLNPKEYGKKGKNQWAFLWTAAFWGFGYTILFVDPTSGSLRPAPVKATRLHGHVRRAQSVPARRELIKPRDVEKHTPAKPTPHESRAQITQVNLMSTARARAVTVTQHGGNENAGNKTEDKHEAVSRKRIEIDKTGKVKAIGQTRPKPNQTNNPRKRSSKGGAGNAARRTKHRK